MELNYTKIKSFFSGLLTILVLVVVLLYPFNQAYWHYGWETEIPYSDFLIILAGIVWLVYFLFSGFKEKKIFLNRQTYYNSLPLLFLLVAAGLSLLNVWPEQLAASFKYLWRFIVFYYLMYFVVLSEIVKEKRQLWTALKGIYFLGIFLSVMGVVSFVWPEVRQSFHLAAPLTWLGLFPYGASHNLLAEALVSIIPFSWLLVYRYQNKNYAKFLYLGLALMIATVVLTFSRTGWLVLFIELLLLSVFYYQVNVRSWLRKYWWIFIWLAMVIIFYWFTLGQTNFVTSSNEARLAMIERSWQLFLDHPLIGNGVGTWQAIISNDVYYVYEFGQPLEQHGVIWKLLAEQGIVGLAVWLGVAAYLIYLPWRRWRQLTPDNHWRWPVIVAWLVIIGQFIFQLFDTGYYSAKMWLPVGLAMVLLNFARENNNLSAAR